MTQETNIFISIGIATILILFGGVFFISIRDQQVTSATVDAAILTRNANHQIKDPTATITIVEFADFQCPACAMTYPVMEQILEEYKGKVTFIYRHFPLPQHQHAVLAARVAEAAGEQEKFWEMYRILYDRQSEWSESGNAEELFTGYAKELYLNTDMFRQKLTSEVYDSKIQQDKSDALKLGVNSTPTLFINNKKLEGGATYINIKNRIDALLQEKGGE